MSVEKKIKDLLSSKKGEQLTEAANGDASPPMQGSSQKATFDTMPGLAGAGRAASAKASKDSSKAAMSATSGDASQPMQGSSKKEPVQSWDEDEENPGAKASAPVSQDNSITPKVARMASQPMQGDSKKATYSNAMESSQEEDGEVIAEVNIKDELSSIFGDDLSEEFRTKATSIFEAAVIARVNSEMEKIAERLEEQNVAQLQEYKETLVEKVDSYLNYVVEQWMEENQIAIDNGLRTEITEEFITGLKGLFRESYIDVPEEKYDVLSELTDKVDSLKDQLDESISDNIEISKMYVQLKKEVLFNEEVEGLADTEVDKLKKLVEGVEFESDELYKEKLSVIKENYFPKESKKSAEQTLVEETEAAPKNFDDSGVMSKYVQAISRTAKSR